MNSFKKLNTKIYQQDKPSLTADFQYWKPLSTPVYVKEFGPVDYVDFSPVEPHFFAVTCSVRVQVYNPITKLVAKNLSRFRENAYGAVFRSDGRLLCAGGEEAAVKLFDVSTKSLLRLFKGHTAAVHRTYFLQDEPQIASFSDDKSVKIWDIATETNILTFNDHTDYVRSGATSVVSPNILLSGSYDNTIKMYDTRTNQTVFSVDHGNPVESLVFLPSGGIFLSAGGTEIKIWDTIAGGKLLGSLSHHHKTITCLRLALDNKRLLSGSLDRHVKVYNISSFEVVHTFDYPNAILSMDISRDDKTLAVGLVDGLVAISRRAETTETQKTEKKNASFQHQEHNLQQKTIDTIISPANNNKESKYDKCLRKFQFSKALDCVLLPYIVNKTPEVTVSVIQELTKRRALHKAFARRERKSILQILRFFIKYITEPRFAKVLIDAADIFITTYKQDEFMMDLEIRQCLLDLKQILKEDAQCSNELAKVQGTMHMLLSAAIQTTARTETVQHNLVPSANAEKSLIVNIS